MGGISARMRHPGGIRLLGASLLLYKLVKKLMTYIRPSDTFQGRKPLDRLNGPIQKPVCNFLTFRRLIYCGISYPLSLHVRCLQPYVRHWA